jgi:putative hydrolase of the HAD superfamily
MPSRPFDVILFDIGGVLVELTGVPRMVELTNWTMPIDGLLRRWLVSPAVRRFEMGKSSPAEFASAVISELEMPVDPERFLREFASWPKGPYPGAASLLEKMRPSFKLASLSNTNEIHWNRIRNEMGIADLFHFNFPSHKTGLLKPDKEAFQFVIDSLSHSPGRILFFDDIQLNVDSALSVGMESYRVSGVAEVVSKLVELGLL